MTKDNYNEKHSYKQKPEIMNESIIYGKNAVIEALEANLRDFNKVLISDNSRLDIKIERIKELAKSHGIVYQFVNKEKLNQITQNANHQGVVAQLSPVKYTDLNDFIEAHSDKYTSVVILDGVEDSHNLGAIIRSSVCAGVDGIIIPSRRGALINPIVEKTSAGAINHISVIKVNSIVNAVQRLKEKNYWVIAADHHAKDNYYGIDYTDMNFALIMGAEHSGISKSLLKLADFVIKIPMLTNFNSLNVSNATAIILFESVRQTLSVSKKEG